jgi:hypothetical protein
MKARTVALHELMLRLLRGILNGWEAWLEEEKKDIHS